jgi:isopentenyl phosphate kinase
MTAELVAIKLGGSLITDKERPDTPRLDVLARVCRDVAALGRDGRRLIVGHGGGSYAHTAATRWGVGAGVLDETGLDGASHTQARAAALHALVVRALLDAGARPFSLAPSSFLVARAGTVESAWLDALALALDRGFLPVVRGDVALDLAWGASIVSTETVLVQVAAGLPGRGYRVTHALWLGETDGVLDERGATIAEIDASEVEAFAARAGTARGADVTGGMAHRLRSVGLLARMGVESWIGDGRRPDVLAAAVSGREPSGTRVRRAPGEEG